MEKEFYYSDNYYVFDTTYNLSAVYGGKFVNDDFIQDSRIMKDYVIWVVIDGTLYIEQDGIESIVQKHEMLLNFPFIEHHGFKKSRSSLYWIHFTTNKKPTKYQKDELIELIKDDDHFLDNKIIIPYHVQLKNYKNVVLLINQYINTLSSYRNKECENNYVRLICAEISRQEIASLIKDKVDLPYRFKQMVDYINVYYYFNINVASLANKFGYNNKYVAYLFKKYLNTSPKKYLEEIRMNHADAILIDTNLSIKEIAGLVGYDDCHVFMKAYKKLRNMTPSAFRKEI